MQLPKTLYVHGTRVLTTRQLAIMYGTEPEIINNNFTRNKTKYALEKHYISVEGEEMRKLKTSHQFDGELKRVSRAYFWTEKGALLHAKSLNTDKAWEVYDYLVDFYFRAKEEKPATRTYRELREAALAEKKQASKPPMMTVVDVPENKEAQKYLADLRKYLTGMEALLDVYDMYHTKERFETIAAAVGEMCSKIRTASFSLEAFTPKLVEKNY